MGWSQAAFFGSILIEEEATIPTVNPRRNHGVQVAINGRARSHRGLMES